MDGRTNRRNEAAFSNSSGVAPTGSTPDNNEGFLLV